MAIEKVTPPVFKEFFELAMKEWSDNQKMDFRKGYLDFRRNLSVHFSNDFVNEVLWYDFDACELIDIYRDPERVDEFLKHLWECDELGESKFMRGVLK